MSSLVWDRAIDEAYINPYEYEVQDQFVREAELILKELNLIFQDFSMKFRRDDKSIKKAIWMLQLDALDSLKDALYSLTSKKHRIAGKLFRDIIETIDLAAFFSSNTDNSNKYLEKWYNDEIVPHRLYRNYIEKNIDPEYAKVKKNIYSDLSKFTHRTYRVLMYGYGLGRDELIWHDNNVESNILVLPHTISMYYAILAKLIKEFISEVIKRELFSKQKIIETLGKLFEAKTVARKFIPHDSL